MPETSVSRLVLSKQQLDERGQLFSATLIEEWVCDPGNVRLLRIALDLYPDVRFLDKILKLLEPGWKDGGSRGANREVRLYCLAELFRAGATETGMVTDQECLPAELDVRAYHERLVKEATDVLLGSIASPSAKKRFPWYLLQQVFLYLAAQNHIPDQDHFAVSAETPGTCSLPTLRSVYGRPNSHFTSGAGNLFNSGLHSLWS